VGCLPNYFLSAAAIAHAAFNNAATSYRSAFTQFKGINPVFARTFAADATRHDLQVKLTLADYKVQINSTTATKEQKEMYIQQNIIRTSRDNAYQEFRALSSAERQKMLQARVDELRKSHRCVAVAARFLEISDVED
jgi:hypothetical protein